MVQVTGAGEEMGKILRNNTTSNRGGAAPLPPLTPYKNFLLVFCLYFLKLIFEIPNSLGVVSISKFSFDINTHFI
jgi:hypothetical protein